MVGTYFNALVDGLELYHILDDEPEGWAKQFPIDGLMVPLHSDEEKISNSFLVMHIGPNNWLGWY
jgi:hypothetical protein